MSICICIYIQYIYIYILYVCVCARLCLYVYRYSIAELLSQTMAPVVQPSAGHREEATAQTKTTTDDANENANQPGKFWGELN